MNLTSEKQPGPPAAPHTGAPERPPAVGPEAHERTEHAPLPSWSLMVLGVLSSLALAAVCWTSGHVHPDPALRAVARFVHVAALVVSLGAVLAVDWFAVLWLLGRRRLTDILSTAATLQGPIWAGLAGLVATGMFLSPDLTSRLTLIKLGIVLVITFNGLYAHRLGRHLDRYRDASVPRGLVFRSGVTAAISQLGWWGATLIGHLNSQ
ncbi:hypothetical protein [Streptomyces coffeae]|uniref:Copper resistance protein D domain-containing protein n=1 Tax=Streptomyces coffeae TaxID=621382 RepID=A0ABS1NMD9_9ACTN|nr:hypothetical protein [Streptomyces coffeae]MBL1100916.1 hypothetical protein [Streptomyces coffeae]